MTCFLQTLFFDLHVFGMFLIGSLFHLQVFFFYIFPYRLSFFIYMFFFFLHISYRPPFSFTCFLHVSCRPPFFIYMLFTGFIHVRFFSFTCLLHVPYMHGPFFPFTWFLQGFIRSISRLRVAFGRIIYTFFTGFSKAM